MKNPKKLIERWMAKIQKNSEKDGWTEELFKDVQIHEKTNMATECVNLGDAGRFVDFKLVPDKDALTIMYDGCGYDFLSREADYPYFRDQLEELLEKNGFIMEDVFSWASIVIRRDA